jgi:hypothetical protein
MLFLFKLRLFFIFFLIAGGFVAMMLNFDPGVSIMMWILSIVLILGYIFFGTSTGALMMLNLGKVEDAEKLLSQTINPKWLLKSHKAYYFFTKGLISLYKASRNDEAVEIHLKEGEDFLLNALNYGLSRKQEKAMAYLNLAHVAFRTNNKEKTVFYFENLKKNETGDLRLQKNIEELEVAISKM